MIRLARLRCLPVLHRRILEAYRVRRGRNTACSTLGAAMRDSLPRSVFSEGFAVVRFVRGMARRFPYIRFRSG